MARTIEAIVQDALGQAQWLILRKQEVIEQQKDEIAVLKAALDKTKTD